MAQSILTQKQQKFLSLFSQKRDLAKLFYLTGGTALSEYYLHHRESDDLDFFSEEEVNILGIQTFLKSIKKELGFKKIDYQSSFNRNLAYLYFPRNYILKTEFTYFPFPRIEKGLNIYGVTIDSLLDLAVNKLFTIYQKPRIRDFIDLYFILKKERWNTYDLLKKAKVKFDWHIDYIQLGTQFIQVKNLLKVDYPKMLVILAKKTLQDFFLNEAIKLKEKIMK
ncbi:MAG: nucleotidyl transferase AbiEii/AbiGii toxin family protein [bacterium]|nr:nucleotidyl transferase AbiEii/AbiGii toxin family protein [bacterium]